MNPVCSLLVIGYGNTLRRDDGVGPHVAQAIEALGLPGLSALSLPQLSPEQAEPVAKAAKVVFVDATRNGYTKVNLTPIKASDLVLTVGHASDPRTILALAKDLFGSAPPAWCLTIPVSDLNFGEGFSLEAHQGCAESLEILQTLYHGADEVSAD